MKRILIGLCLLTLALDCSADTEADVAAAKTAIKEFADALQTELKSAMQTGGPVKAIGVCNTQAGPIAEKLSADHGMNLGRVSLQNRNPANEPNSWQNAVLKDFEHRKAAGEDVTSLMWTETANIEGRQEFRLMKAIPTAGVCLACHGSKLSPEVSQVLAETYPDDKATGFAEGDIRGAFVVTRVLSD